MERVVKVRQGSFPVASLGLRRCDSCPTASSFGYFYGTPTLGLLSDSLTAAGQAILSRNRGFYRQNLLRDLLEYL